MEAGGTANRAPEAGVVRAALVGAGLVGQVCHLVTLTRPGSAIRLGAVVDASRSRAEVIAAAHGVPAATGLDELAAIDLDAVVIAAPDPTHRPLIEQSLARGWHVFCEKPLALTAADCDALAAAAARSGLVCRVGYMKRFDPAVDRLIADIRDRGATVTAIAVEVRDPDASPFVRPGTLVPTGDDIDPALIAAGVSAAIGAADAVLGRPGSPAERTAWAAFTGALIHDLDLVRLIVPEPLEVVDAFHALGGLQVGARLVTSDGRVLRMVHTQDRTIADYEERFTIYTTCGVYELIFPAPYLLHRPTTLRRIEPKDADEVSAIVDLNDSTDEAFDRELQAFAAAVRGADPGGPRVDLEDAATDIRLLEDAFRMSAGVR
jgi:predicted dehydrogenase